MKILRCFAAVCAALCLLVLGGHGHAETEAPKLTLLMINVGKADALLLQCEGESMLVDGGWAASARTVQAAIEDAGITRLTAMVATHPDSDHIGGLSEILRSTPTNILYMNRLSVDSKPYRNLCSAIADTGTPLAYLLAGDSFTLGGATIDVVSPTQDLIDLRDENESSIVLLVRYLGRSILLAADALENAETTMLSAGISKVDVLKVAHHGRNDATSHAFLAALDPSICLISSGYDDGEWKVDERLIRRLAGRQIYRTDQDGSVLLTVDASGIHVTALSFPQTAQYIFDAKKMLFHLPSCDGLPKKRGVAFTSTREAALDAGYTPCDRCNP